MLTRVSSNRKKNECYKGSALIVAIIIIAILIIFTFSLMLVSYTLYSSQNKRVAGVRCSEAANSLSIAMKRELEDEDASQNSDLWKYLRFNLMQPDWTFYDPNESGHGEAEAFRHYSMKINPNYIDTESGKSTLDGYPGKVDICIYWMLPEELYEDEDFSSAGVDVSSWNMSQKKNVRLFMIITCETASQSYSVTNEYRLSVNEYNIEILSDKNEKNSLENSYKSNSLYNENGRDIDSSEKWRWKEP